ncbi:MAG: hypothetical protein ABWZ99_06350 [Ilumatobacteraceae bacterium]
MFTTGTKFLIGSTVVASIAALAYGITQDGIMGTVGLISAALALAFLAGVNIYTRDSNVLVTPDLVPERTPAAKVAPAFSVWPFAFAVAAVTIVVGLVSYQAITIIGLLLLLAAGAEWMAQAWSERASADNVHNAEVRSRMANPFEFPIAGAIAIGIIVYSFSRIMLWLSKTNTVLAFGILAMVFLAFAFLFAYRPSIKHRAVVSVIVIGAIGLVAGGAAAGISGEREIEEHETTAELALEGGCEDPGETHADEKASQTVAATASVAARITLAEDGTLSYDLNGPNPQGQDDTLTLPRTSPSNVLFINESDEHRRLTFDFGPMADPEDGAEDVFIPNQVCTTLVETNGEQLVTLNPQEPSFAFPDGFRIFVPGVETAQLGLVVP